MSMNELNLLRNELETQSVFANSLQNELEAINSRAKNGKVLKKDIKRVHEIEDLLKTKKAWITKAKAEIKAFYRPATDVA